MKIALIGLVCLLIGSALGILFSTPVKKFILAMQMEASVAERRRQLQQTAPQGTIAMIGDSQIAGGSGSNFSVRTSRTMGSAAIQRPAFSSGSTALRARRRCC